MWVNVVFVLEVEMGVGPVDSSLLSLLLDLDLRSFFSPTNNRSTPVITEITFTITGSHKSIIIIF